MDVQTFHHRITDGRARVQRGVGVLKDNLHIPPHGLQVTALKFEDICPIQVNLSGRWLNQAQHGATDSGFAASRFAYQTQRLAFFDVKAHIVQGLHPGDDALQYAAFNGKIFFQIPDLDKLAASGLVRPHFGFYSITHWDTCLMVIFPGFLNGEIVQNTQ